MNKEQPNNTKEWEEDKEFQERKKRVVKAKQKLDRMLEEAGIEIREREREEREAFRKKELEYEDIDLLREQGKLAENKEDINENTKVYIGEWNIEVFNTVKKYPNITHLYESFPDKKIFMQTLETDPNIDSPEKAKQALEDKDIYLSSFEKEILEKTEFSGEQKEYNLVRFTVDQLGLPDRATTDEIYAKAIDLGLELCPAEIGPQLRLQYTGKEWMAIAMQQIVDCDDDPVVFYLVRDGARLELDALDAEPDFRWRSVNGFVFLAAS
jgi:hypothetical protein